jgi:hypothetical protein
LSNHPCTGRLRRKSAFQPLPGHVWIQFAFLPGGRPTTTQIWNRLNYSSRTLGDLLTLNSCQNEQDSMTLFLAEFRPPGQQRHYKCLAQDERGCRVTAREPLARDDPAKDEIRDDGEQQHHRHRFNRIKPSSTLTGRSCPCRTRSTPWATSRSGLRRRPRSCFGSHSAVQKKVFSSLFITYLALQTQVVRQLPPRSLQRTSTRTDPTRLQADSCSKFG